MFKRQQPESRAENERAAILMRSYNRTVFWSRLLTAAFFTTYGIAMFYLIPWFPGGTSADSYTNSDLAIVVVLLFTAATAFAMTHLRERARVSEQALAGWSSVHEGLSDMRQREYFFDRVVFECARSRTSGGEFTVLALRLDEKLPADIEKLNKIMAALKPVVKEADCAAAMGPHEVCVLAQRVHAPAAQGFADGVRGLAETALPDHDIRIGWSVYGRDGTDAGDLIGLARQALARSVEPVATERLDATAENQSLNAA